MRTWIRSLLITLCMSLIVTICYTLPGSASYLGSEKSEIGAELMIDPQLEFLVSPQYVGARPSSDDDDEGVTPSAFFFVINDLEPNTEYEFHTTATFGLIQVESGSTRGNYWNYDQEDWVGPSTTMSLGETDENGSISFWGYWRAPGGFEAGIDEYQVRLRVREVGSTDPFTFDDQSPHNISALYFSTEAEGETAGALVTAIIGEVEDNNYYGNHVLAFENEDDERPLASFLIQPHDLHGTNSLDELAEGYVQLVVPANTQIAKFEVRDNDNNILETLTGDDWSSGEAGSVTDFGDIYGEAEVEGPQLDIAVSPQYIGGRPEREDAGVSPTAFYFVISDLQPNTAYEYHETATFGLRLKDDTATRGNYWNFDQDDWVGPSTGMNLGTTDDEGTLEIWGYWRAPDFFFSDQLNDYHVRLRVRVVGTTEPITFDDGNQSPNNLTTLHWDSTATGETAGAIITGVLNDEQLHSQHVLAFENEDDERPLAAWKAIPHDQYEGSNSLDSLGGYFQMIVPANTPVNKLEIRDDNNAVITTLTSDTWSSGDPGTITDLGGGQVITHIDDERIADMPTEYQLRQNYPNPFNPTTQIEYTVSENGHVLIEVYNMLGQQVATLVDRNLNAGEHSVTFNASSLSSGIYMYRMQAGSEVLMKKMTLIK